jgi:transcriptional regulator with PAS, ATPase and Fis domain
MNAQFYKTRSERSVETLQKGRENSVGNTRRTGNSKIEALNQKIERYARVGHHVLLTGERGTGKTTIARQIHDKSTRRKKPFVSLNCATLQAELVEAELFGYEKGAFTGANCTKAGLFETGSGGTVFLDEVGELPLSLQAKLLKAVEEKRVRRVGASTEIPVDLRIIAATSRNLREMLARGEFRADLYDRLNVLSLNTIPLREQEDKIRALVFAGLEQERIALGRKMSFEIEPSALALLENYVWTGNFRELQNFVLKLATEQAEASVITEREVRALLDEKEFAGNEFEKSAEQFIAAPPAADNNHLVLEINPDEHLDFIIERVKERYIIHHLKNKSHRQTAQQCGIDRSMIKRIADKFQASNF